MVLPVKTRPSPRDGLGLTCMQKLELSMNTPQEMPEQVALTLATKEMKRMFGSSSLVDIYRQKDGYYLVIVFSFEV